MRLEFPLAPWRKLWIGGPLGEGPELEALLGGGGGVVGGSVQVGLPEDDHPDVGVEINLAGLGARES